MRQITYILTFVFLTGCGNSNQKTESKEINSDKLEQEKIESVNNIENLQNQTNANTIDFQRQTLSSEFKNAKLYNLTDTIEADFNGDGNVDKAVFIKDNQNSGIIIKHGETLSQVKIGFGQPFAHLTNFNWVDFWGLVNDSTSYEILFNETDIICDTIIRLENPSIVVRKEEVGGGLITFKNGEYKWIHQSD
jgi:outer membrane biogenesis lipoprotein LolB